MRSLLIPLFALTLSACAGGGDAPRGAAPSASIRPTVDWRTIATAQDRRRLREWRTAWVAALAEARAAGHGAELDREGVLLDPDAALPGATPPAGDYQCRTIKIGSQSGRSLNYIAYPFFSCRVRIEQGLLSFAKLTGSQRPIGLLFEESDRRMVFLGTLQLGDERRALQYGRDRLRDMIGAFERVGERRWRLVLPYPHFESTMDVIELVPRAPT